MSIYCSECGADRREVEIAATASGMHPTDCWCCEPYVLSVDDRKDRPFHCDLCGDTYEACEHWSTVSGWARERKKERKERLNEYCNYNQ